MAAASEIADGANKASSRFSRRISPKTARPRDSLEVAGDASPARTAWFTMRRYVAMAAWRARGKASWGRAKATARTFPLCESVIGSGKPCGADKRAGGVTESEESAGAGAGAGGRPRGGAGGKGIRPQVAGAPAGAKRMARWSNVQLVGLVFLPVYVVVWIALLVVLLAVAPCPAGSACFQAFLAFVAALPLAGIVSFALVQVLRRAMADA